MAEKLDPRQVVTFEELLRACLYEQEATRRVLVGKGVLTNEEMLEEVKRFASVKALFIQAAKEWLKRQRRAATCRRTGVSGS